MPYILAKFLDMKKVLLIFWAEQQEFALNIVALHSCTLGNFISARRRMVKAASRIKKYKGVTQR